MGVSNLWTAILGSRPKHDAFKKLESVSCSNDSNFDVPRKYSNVVTLASISPTVLPFQKEK